MSSTTTSGPRASTPPAAPAVELRRVVRTFWPWAAPRAPWMVVALCLTAVSPLLTFAEVWLFKTVVDEVLVPRDFGPFAQIAAAYVGLTLLQGVLDGASRMLSAFLAARFLIDLRQALLRHLGSLPLEFFTRNRLGDLLARVTGDVGAIETFLVSGTTRTLTSVLELVVFSVALFWIQPVLALVSLVVAPLFWWCSRHFSRRMREVSRERQRRSGSISSCIEGTLAAMPLVQAFGRVEGEVDRFALEAEAKYRADLSSARLRSVYAPTVDLIELLGALVVIGLGAWMLSRGELTVGALLAFLALLTRLYGPVQGLGNSLTTAYTAAAGAERVVELLDQEPLPADRTDALELTRSSGAVALSHVSYRYPGGTRPALEDVSFRVDPGEMVAVVGASGAGKSTLVRLLTRSLDPDSGRVSLDGHDLRDLTRHSLRRQTGVVLQETLVHDGTVRDTIAFGRPGASEEEVVRAARSADAHDFVTALPQGYDTPVGDRGRRFSGGQARRLALARALLLDAPVVILDEPTTGLDAAARDRVVEPLRRLAEGRSTVVVTHDLETARLADRIVVLDAGRLTEQGSHDELLLAGGTYASLWARPTGVPPVPTTSAVPA